MNRFTTKHYFAHQFLMLLTIVLFLASCGSRRSTVNPSNAAAKAAEAMAGIKSKSMYRFINDWSGVKYKLGGLDKRGIDCSGFAVLLNREIYGKNIPRRSRDQADKARRINTGSLDEGDMVFFSFGGREVDHVGIYLNNGYFVHASTTRGVIVESLSIPAYQNNLVKAGQIKK